MGEYIFVYIYNYKFFKMFLGNVFLCLLLIILLIILSIMGIVLCCLLYFWNINIFLFFGFLLLVIEINM